MLTRLSLYCSLMILCSGGSSVTKADPISISFTTPHLTGVRGSTLTFFGFYTNSGAVTFNQGNAGIGNDLAMFTRDLAEAIDFTTAEGFRFLNFPRSVPAMSSTPVFSFFTFPVKNDAPLGLYNGLYFVGRHVPGETPIETQASFSFTVTNVPEPAGLLLLGTGLATAAAGAVLKKRH